MRISEDDTDQLALKILVQVLQHRQGGAGQRGVEVGIADVGKVLTVSRDMPLPGAPPRRQDRVTHLARLDGLPRQEPFPGLGQPAVTGHLRPPTCSARHPCPPVCNRCYHGASRNPGWPRDAGRAGWDGGRGAEPSRYVHRRGAVLAGAGGSPLAARRRHRAGPGPGGPRPRGRQRRSLSSCHRFRIRIRSRQARDLARRLATGTGSLSRMRGTASAMTTAMAMARPAACAPAVAPGKLAAVGG